MARKYLTRAEERDITKKISSYNRRISELSRQKRFQGVILPEKINAIQAVAGISTAVQKRQLLTRLEQIRPDKLEIKTTKRGLKVTSGFLEQTERERRAANRIARERRKGVEQKPVLVGKTKLGTVGKMHRSRLEEASPLFSSIQDIPSEKAIRQHVSAVRKRTSRSDYLISDQRLKDNFIYAIKLEFPGKDISDLIKKYEDMPLANFIDAFYTEPNIDFTFVYSLEQYKEKYNELMEVASRWDGSEKKQGDKKKKSARTEKRKKS